MSKKIKLYVAIPTVGNVLDGQEYVRRRLEKIYGDRIEFVYPERCTRRIFHDFARNSMVKDFLATDCDVMWFLDSDVLPPDNVLDLVTEHWDKWQAAGCPYPVFMTVGNKEDDIKQVVMAMYKKSEETGGMHACAVPTGGGTGFVDGIATGCIFLKRSVFEGMEEPYFEFKYDAKTRHIIEGEDLGFCFKLAKRGIQFFTDYSMVCGHEKKVDLLDVNNYAINYANNAIKAYDATIRSQIEAAVGAAKQLGYVKGYQAAQQEIAPEPKKAASIIWHP